jgi:hypothetical protein
VTDWIDDLVHQHLDGLDVSSDAWALVASLGESARGRLLESGNQETEAQVRANLEKLMRTIEARVATAGGTGIDAPKNRPIRGREPAVFNEPGVVNVAVVEWAKRSFCPKWPWC